MKGDRIRVAFKIDAEANRVTRDGVVVELHEGRVVHAGGGVTTTLGTVMLLYEKSDDLGPVVGLMSPDMQEAVGEVLLEALGISGDGEARWVEIATELLPPPAGRRDLARRAEDMASFIRRLPWPLACVAGRFLAQYEWVFTLAGQAGAPPVDQILPPEPRVLLIVPEADPETLGAQHLVELKAVLEPNYSPDAFESNIRVATTWQGVVEIIGPHNFFDPEIIYYYGHGLVEDFTACLRFDTARGPDAGQARGTESISIRQVEAVLRKLAANRRPALFFANCCSGAIASRGSVGDHVGPWVGCVIANRTVVDTSAARVFGEGIFRALVDEVQAPHDFMASVTATVVMKVVASELGGRWASPVVHTNYDRWIALHQRRFTSRQMSGASRFIEHLDRVVPVQGTISAMQALIAETGTRLRALTWQAEAQQGGAAFTKRLCDELRRRFTTVTLREKVVDLQHDAWPAFAEDRRIQIIESLYSALAPADALDQPMRKSDSKGKRLGDVAQLLKTQLAQGDVVLLVLTNPVPVVGDLGQEVVRDYWDVWLELAKALGDIRRANLALRILLALGLEVEPGIRVEVPSLIDADPSGIGSLSDLDVLHSVSAQDILTHMLEYRQIYDTVSTRNLAARAGSIHQETGGIFAPTVISLKQLARIL